MQISIPPGPIEGGGDTLPQVPMKAISIPPGPIEGRRCLRDQAIYLKFQFNLVRLKDVERFAGSDRQDDFNSTWSD